jgi:hypothetical protein
MQNMYEPINKYKTRNYSSALKKKNTNYKPNSLYPPIIKELQSIPSRISGLEKKISSIGDCGSCPSCACINANSQVLAVIEAPATVPLLVTVGGIKVVS